MLRAVATRFHHHARDDAGQTAVLFLIVLFFFTVAGVLVVDVGLWYADRRLAQTDADLIALAAAQELPDFADNAGAKAAAEAAALDWAAFNDVAPEHIRIDVIDTCFAQAPATDPVFTGVRVTVTQPTDSYFVSLFGASRTAIRASATACSGRPAEMVGFLPFAIEQSGECFIDDPLTAQRVPRFGALCELVVGGSGGASGDVGQLAFDAGGGDCYGGNGSASVYEQHIINGVLTRCAIGDSVTSNTGVNVGKTLSGLQARLARESLCSMNAVPFFGQVLADTLTFNAQPDLADLAAPGQGMSGGGVDDFFEVWRPGAGYGPGAPAAGLEPADCDPGTALAETSPRNVVLIVVSDIAVDDGTGCHGTDTGPSPHCYEVQGFGRMYIEGCLSGGGASFSPTCDLHGAGGSLTILGRFVESVENGNLGLGLEGFGGVQTILVE